MGIGGGGTLCILLLTIGCLIGSFEEYGLRLRSLLKLRSLLTLLSLKLRSRSLLKLLSRPLLKLFSLLKLLDFLRRVLRSLENPRIPLRLGERDLERDLDVERCRVERFRPHRFRPPKGI